SDEGGVHHRRKTHKHQVPLQRADRKPDEFRFASFEQSTVKYDAFMEPCPERLSDELGVPADDLEIDHYGIKPVELLGRKRYVLTSRKLKKPTKVLPLSLRPIESSISSVVSAEDEGVALLYLGRPSDLV